jgi:sugar (pentulose or hexulose) kinase
LPPARVDGARVTQDPRCWWDASDAAVARCVAAAGARRVRAMAVAGTSGTVLLTDAAGLPLTDGWMYHDASCVAQAARIEAVAPHDTAARSVSSALARLLHLQAVAPQARHVLHQADWIAARVCGQVGVADENNVLKLGYDVVARRWPAWFDALGVRRELLPRVVAPGTAIGTVVPEHARRWGLDDDVVVAAGTTDGVAAFVATGACEVGDGVSSLGSTLVVKLLGARPVFAPAFGVYSHRLGDLWLTGGASNSGGAALLCHFDLARLQALTPMLQPERDTGLDYYPLPRVGERFPFADPRRESCVSPRPSDDAQFLQGLLEGIAAIERRAYDCIREWGGGCAQRVFSVGGGARNPAWSRIRQRRLGVPLTQPRHEEAACGAAVFARRALERAG